MKAPCEYNPDQWFTTLPAGVVKKSDLTRLKNDVKSAIDACFECPAMIACGELGMLPENIYYGIWGGLMPAERLSKVGHKKSDDTRGSVGYTEFKMMELVYATV